MNPFKKRREELAKRIVHGAAVLASGSPRTRSHDTHFPFRVDSNFHYLTGLEEPEGLIVLSVCGGRASETLFARPKDPHSEMWEGVRLGVDKAREMAGTDQAFPSGEFSAKLPRAPGGAREGLFQPARPGAHVPGPRRHRPFRTTAQELLGGPLPAPPSPPARAHEAREGFPRDRTHEKGRQGHRDGAPCGHGLRLPRKNRAGGSPSSWIWSFAGRPGATAYSPIVAGGRNGLVLHYTENSAPLAKGETLLIDAGAQYGLYASDVTRTFPIDGTFSGPQREIYSLVLEAQKEAIKLSVPGQTPTAIHKKASMVLIEGLVSLGVLAGDPGEIWKGKKHTSLYPHGTRALARSRRPRLLPLSR